MSGSEEESAEDKQTETCERCGDGEVSARVTVQADYDDAMQATYRICNDCVGSLGEWYDDSAGGEHDDESTHSVCLACGQIKPNESFREGSTRCQECIGNGLSDQYRFVGDGFVLKDDCHEANGGECDGA